ncbi:Mu transposase domain-containing protein, partial [Vallitalea maricola]|uniref:Mu transposase domain-containing protein n=1 Tax=Vallitalea maricola TaxID=3074433 RepID=UPI003C12C528
MIKYKGKKYSVPTKYIGKKVHVNETSDGNICIYYNEDFIVCHPIGEKRFNYKLGHMHEILKSDACKHLSDKEINTFI